MDVRYCPRFRRTGCAGEAGAEARGRAGARKEKAMILGIFVGIVTICVVAVLGVVGFAALGVAGIVESCEDADEPLHDETVDLAGRIGRALESILTMPYSRSS